MKKWIYTSLVSLLACSQLQAQNPVLSITGGKVQGVETAQKGTVCYKGIPFAAPAGGENRWREPQPVQLWSGVKVADHYGPIAWQEKHAPYDPNAKVNSQPGMVDYVKEFFQKEDPKMDEDCLYLNVWTPAAGNTTKNLPVAIWYHGGAYRSGYAYEPEFDGEAYAKRGVILVSVTYRLGVFGFLAHPELSAESKHGVSGNYGILDQVAAIDWVRQNIRQFGGNPDNITIFGQSAGAGSVMTLLASPLTKGKVAKAIIQSGGGITSLGKAQTVQQYAEMGKKMFGSQTLAQLRAKSYDELNNEMNQWTRTSGVGFLMLSPVVDGYLMDKSFTEKAEQGLLPRIPILFGGTLDDMPFARVGEAHYKLAEALTKAGKAPYLYAFDRRLPGDNAGAFHSSELWYVFGTLQKAWRPFTDADYKLSNRMLDYWTNFMKQGDPNGASLPQWTACNGANKSVMHLNVE